MDLPLRKSGVPLADTVSAGDVKRHFSTAGMAQKRPGELILLRPVSRKNVQLDCTTHTWPRARIIRPPLCSVINEHY